MFIIVKLEKKILGKILEKILVESAKEMGLNASIYDDYVINYKLGTLSDEKQIYTKTSIILTKAIFPILEIDGIRREKKQNYFLINNHHDMNSSFFGFSSQRQIEKYLTVISEKLKRIE